MPYYGNRGVRSWSNYRRYPSSRAYYGAYPYGIYNYPSTVVVDEVEDTSDSSVENKRMWTVLGSVIAVVVALIIIALLMRMSSK